MVQVSILATFTFALAAFALSPNNAGARDVGNGQGAQFTTGGCVSDADCQSACCAGGAEAADGSGGEVGICSAEAASLQNGKTGCGFADPNAAATLAAAQAQVEAQGF
ncbi:putative biotrophy-associated secreted protein 2 [Rosellinia necatrix]|uniref:Putative biotrophy-associated secreted protein 2 n=1 Tax=Rosellinia necatrix TaxID=77044 RepID=A0A1S7UKZ6_ROSNE|nr:putative biotrophy-associated secreted protein 2 [Rosellinia necatrix]